MLLLPYPPSTNRYWRNFRGRMIRSTQAEAYKLIVEHRAKKANIPLHSGCVRVDMLLHPPRPKDWERRERKDANWVLGLRRIDLDNAMKVALDALQGIAFENDRQITCITIGLGHAVEAGGLSIKVGNDLIWGAV